MSVIANPSEDLVVDDRTRRVHQSSRVFDGLAISYVLDEKFTRRCLEGGVSAANVTFALEENWDQTLHNFERYLTKIDKSPLLTLCTTADDFVAAKEKGKLGIVIGTQGASMIEDADQFWRLETMSRMGLRFLGLIYTTSNAFGDGCGEKRDAGLTSLGEELIALANTLPLMLDLSQCGHRARAEATALARAPVCTHSNSDQLRPNCRNTTDATAKAMAAKGGMVGVCGLPQLLSDDTPTLDDLLDHLDHYVKLLGVEHVGIGMDYAESFGRQSYPIGIESVRKLPNFTQGLFDRGYSESDVQALLGDSWLRAMRKFCG